MFCELFLWFGFSLKKEGTNLLAAHNIGEGLCSFISFPQIFNLLSHQAGQTLRVHHAVPRAEIVLFGSSWWGETVLRRVRRKMVIKFDKR